MWFEKQAFPASVVNKKDGTTEAGKLIIPGIRPTNQVLSKRTSGGSLAT